MGTRDAVLSVGAGVVAVLHLAIGVAILMRSRHQRGVILWRGQRIGAPRLAACTYLLGGLFFATTALSDVFEPRTNGDDLVFLAGTVFAAAGVITGLVWLVRRRGPRRTRRHHDRIRAGRVRR
ncbi:hypothetical protein AAH979_33485 [Plantactinospora sp. ZYX-F-223]|uniref:hypothetical protein n=1 Tax=Plantactinospora sp. ZYX-F-223 TaxID=3144103 RepID=UPI0031FD7FED